MNQLPDSEDTQLRRLLEDAVSPVEPRETLDSIRARTAVTPLHSRRPWLLGAGAAVVATAATVAAVAVMGGGPGTTGTAEPGFATGPSAAASSAPTAAGDPTPSSGPSAGASNGAAAKPATVPVYYVGDTTRGPRLFREFHSVETGNPAQAAVAEAVAARPDDPDYRTAWPAGTAVRAVSFDGAGNDGLIEIDLATGSTPLRDRPAQMPAQEAAMAVEQLVYSAQGALQNTAPVQFYVDGKRSDTVLGVPTSEPLARGEKADVLAQVWITGPTQGARVSVPFEVTGLANAFEANVQWELMDGNTVVTEGFAMADEAFTMAPYKFRVEDAVPPGEYTLVVHDEDASGGAEGAGPWTDTKTITVVD